MPVRCAGAHLQVSVQQDFPIQCCKLQTLHAFKNRPEDKSMNMWWNVYLQFQTKITDDSLRAGIPWAADQLLAPIREGVRPVSPVQPPHTRPVQKMAKKASPA